jgi:hypothetical protein
MIMSSLGRRHFCIPSFFRFLSRKFCDAKLSVKCYVAPSQEYLLHYFDNYSMAWNKYAEVKKDDNYASETVETLSQFKKLHVHVAEDCEENLKAGTILIEIRDDDDLNRLR